MTATPPRVALALALAACNSESTLDVVVHHPTGVVIASTDISVYVSSELTCDNVRFGDLDDTELDGLRVADETLFANAPAQGSLDGLPRVAPKVIAARGFGADGSLAAGGCIEVGEVDSDTTVTIDTEVAAIASVATAKGSDGSDTYGIDITATDADGNPLAGREVSWRVYGAAGTAPAGSNAVAVGSAGDSVWELPAPTCTNSDGVANLHPIPPNLTGGYEVRPRVAWTQHPVADYSTLTQTGNFVSIGEFPAGVNHPCAVGHAAGVDPPEAVVCVDSTGQVDFVTATVAADGAVTVTKTASVAGITTSGVVSVAQTGGDVDVFAYEPGTKTLTTIYGAAASRTCNGCGAYDDVIFAPSCGSDSPPIMVGHVASANGLDSVETVDLSRALLVPTVLPLTAAKAGFNNIQLLSGGCVTELDSSGSSSVSQVIAMQFASAGDLASVTRVIDHCTLTACKGIDLAVAGGVGFTAGSTPEIVVPTANATGIELSSDIVLASSGSADATTVALATVPSLGVPETIVVGQFDDDGLADLAWNNDATHASVVQLAYAHDGPDGPLSALLPASFGKVTDLVVGDVTGDGFDDLAMVSTDFVGIVTILPGRAKADTGPIGADSSPGTCPSPFP